MGAVLLGAVYLVAGILKLLHPESFRLREILGVGGEDPSWLPTAAAAAEVGVGFVLISGFHRNLGLVFSVVLAGVFCLYHIGLGLLSGAPT